MKKLIASVLTMLILVGVASSAQANKQAACAAKASQICAKHRGDDRAYNACWNDVFNACMRR